MPEEPMIEYLGTGALLALRGRWFLQKQTWSWKAAQWVCCLTLALPAHASLHWVEGFPSTQDRAGVVVGRRGVCNMHREAQRCGGSF